MRSATKKLVKATANCKYPHEQGEPFTTCLALRNVLIMALDLKIVLTYEEIQAVMLKLMNSWDDVLMARSHALGQRITEDWVRESEEHDEFVWYLDFLKVRGIPQVELDAIYIKIFNSVISQGASNA